MAFVAKAVEKPDLLDVKPLTAWSYSRLSAWNECPRRVYYTHVEKRKEPTTKALERGTHIHGLAEDYLRTSVTVKRPLPVELANFALGFEELRKRRAEPEVEIVLDSSWAPVRGPDRPWFSPLAWLRAKIDAVVPRRGTRVDATDRATLIDFKTGRNRGEGAHKDQLELYAVAAFSRWVNLARVEGSVWYLDHDLTGRRAAKPTFRMDRSDLPAVVEKWNSAVRPMLADTEFHPRPGMACRWCPHSIARGGPCKVGV